MLVLYFLSRYVLSQFHFVCKKDYVDVNIILNTLDKWRRNNRNAKLFSCMVSISPQTILYLLSSVCPLLLLRVYTTYRFFMYGKQIWLFWGCTADNKIQHHHIIACACADSSTLQHIFLKNIQ